MTIIDQYTCGFFQPALSAGYINEDGKVLKAFTAITICESSWSDDWDSISYLVKQSHQVAEEFASKEEARSFFDEERGYDLSVRCTVTRVTPRPYIKSKGGALVYREF